MRKLFNQKNPAARRGISTILALALILQLFVPLPGFNAVADGEEGGGTPIAADIPVAITKTVDRTPIVDWLYTRYGESKIAAATAALSGGMSYAVYEAEFIDDRFSYTEDSHVTDARLNEYGKIAFEVKKSGWYAVVEELTSPADTVFGEAEPLYVYIGSDGVMSSLNAVNAGGTYTTHHTGGYNLDLKLIYENGYEVTGQKPDGSQQWFCTEKFDVYMPDGSWATSFCADLGAHNIFGSYMLDENRHGFSDFEMFYIIAAFDYIDENFRSDTVDGAVKKDGAVNGLSTKLGKAIAQVVLWNLILKVDKNAGYADDWWYWIPDKVNPDTKVVKIEGYGSWYTKEISDLVDGMVADPEKYVDIYQRKLAGTLKDPYVTGVFFIKGNDPGQRPIDQQRQILVLFGNSVEFDNTLYYDVALCKWVSKVQRDAATVWTNAGVNEDVPAVKPGDKVTFTIEVYNQTDNPTWVSKVVDYVPDGYTFAQVDNPLWSADGGDGAGPRLLRYNGEPIPLANEDASAKLYVVLGVISGADENSDFWNAAEVLEIMDETTDEHGVRKPGKRVDDIDSTFTPEERERWYPWVRWREKDNEVGENGKKGGDKDDFDFAEVKLDQGLIDITVTKTWVDNGNAYNTRPGAVTVDLRRKEIVDEVPTDVVIDTKTITDSGGAWTATFSDLPDHNAQGSADSIYSVVEREVSGYQTPVIAGSATGGFTVTNKLAPGETSVTVNKVWNDGSGASRPGSVTFDLLQDGLAFASKTVGAGDLWAWTFDGLPLYSTSDQHKYLYTVTEAAVAGYRIDPVAVNADGSFTFTNTLLTKVDVVKEWDDRVDAAGMRPAEIDVNLLRDGAVIERQSVTGALYGNWTHTFADLPAYAPDRREYVYTITEDTVPGYNTSIAGSTIINELEVMEKVITINVIKNWINKYVIPKALPESVSVQLYRNDAPMGEPVILNAGNSWQETVTIVEEEIDDIFFTVREQTGTWSPEYSASYKYEKRSGDESGYEYDAVITNTLLPPLTDIRGVKKWVDDDNNNNTRPVNVTMILTRDGIPIRYQTIEEDGMTGKWEFSFTDLPIFDEGDLHQYVYRVAEETTPGYRFSADCTDISSVIVTNTLEPGEMYVPVIKVWADDENKEGKRPGSVTFRLLRNGTEFTTYRMTAPWSAHAFGPLPKYDAAQKPYVYTVTEDTVPGYKTGVVGDAAVGFTFINTVDPEQIETEIRVTKEWVDNGDANHIRPLEIGLLLYRDGVPCSYSPGNVASAKSGNSWTYTITGLPKYDAGYKPYTYMVDEVPVPGYNKSVAGNASAGFTITNTLAPGVISVSVEKVWQDGMDISKRPEELMVKLYQDGAEYHDGARYLDVTMTSYSWKHTFANLPKYGPSPDYRQYVYTVDEITVPDGYIKTISGNAAEGFVITNAREGTVVSGKKTWVDNDDAAEKRPYTIRVDLMREGVSEPVNSMIAGFPRWEWSFVMPTGYSYSVRESVVPADYAVTYDGYNITNTYVYAPVSVALEARKETTGPEGARIPALTDRQFSFGVYEGESLVAAGVSDAGGRVLFAAISFTEKGVYTYKIKETSPGNARWATDDRIYHATVVITEDKGVLKVESVVYSDGEGALGVDGEGAAVLPLFTNVYSPPPPTNPEDIEGEPPEPPPPPPGEPPKETDADDDADGDGDDDGDSDTEELPGVIEETTDNGNRPPRRPPGGTDQGVPPNPSVDGHSIVAGEDGVFIEFDEDGVPLGEWRWDDEEEMWVFDEYPPLGSLPRTGATGLPGVMLLRFTMFALGLLLLLANMRAYKPRHGRTR